jgi:NADP-dependent 3-hydroxy acid dehydrogenase YdfG
MTTARLEGKTAFVTGASSGIGAATALLLARLGARLVIGARRIDRLNDVAERARAAGSPAVTALPLDVRDRASIERFCGDGLAAAGGAHILIANAGLARGLAPVERAEDADWVEMVESNVLGVLRTARALIPALVASGDGHVVLVGSIAGHQAYEGGSAYCGTKAAVTSIRQVLRLELVDRGVRVSSVDPGMVETEFSLVRFSGDAARADKVYEGVTPLCADDVADVIGFVVTRPAHVNVDEVLVTPRAQAAVYKVHRR